MLLNDQLAREVLNAWTLDQNHPHKGRDKKPIPSEKDIALLLDTMFRASLLREEGKSISSSVAWISESDFEKHEIPQRRDSPLTLEFDAPIEFCAENLAKLNGIVNGRTGTLLACHADSGDCIWGICYISAGVGAIGEIPAATMEARHFSPDCPTVTITGVGSMRITRADSVIGRIEGGTFLRAQPTVLTSFMLGQFLYRLVGIEVDLASRKFQNPEDADLASAFCHCVEFLIEVLSQRRLGATIIFVPPDVRKDVNTEAETAWKVHGSLEINRLNFARKKFQDQAKASKDLGGMLFRLKIDQALRHRIRSLVDLSCIDGALLLTPTFDVIGFGMKLKSPKWGRDVEHGTVLNSLDMQHLDFSRLGTRHNSALNFVGSFKGAVAFVASSDGPIRVLVNSSDTTVSYWPDCRVSMFAT